MKIPLPGVVGDKARFFRLDDTTRGQVRFFNGRTVPTMPERLGGGE